MKNILIALSLLSFVGANAQITASGGHNNKDFRLDRRQPGFAAYSNAQTDFFIIKGKQNFQNLFTIIAADKAGTINFVQDIAIKQSMYQAASIGDIFVVGNNIAAMVDNHDKNTKKNTMSIRLIDNSGNLSNTDMPVGEFPFEKMGNPGEWYTTTTPDKKHIAVVGKLPSEKNVAEQFVYYFLDENLKQVSTGKFSFPENTKKIPIFHFLASDKGDLYLISEEFDKSYKYPIVYKATPGSETGTIIPVMFADAGIKNLNYMATVNAAGELVIAGYMQKKEGFSVGETKAIGSWLFNSSKPAEIKTFPFDKPIANLTIRNIVYNGDTFFLVGEQYKSEKDDTPAGATGFTAISIAQEDNRMYYHDGIEVTAFSADGTKKFDLPIARKMKAHNFDQELMVASGIVNNKLALIYNEQFGKYFDGFLLKEHRLPISVSVNNDGLMDAPVFFKYELDGRNTDYTLWPQFFNANNGQVTVLLSTTGSIVKTETFK